MQSFINNIGYTDTVQACRKSGVNHRLRKRKGITLEAAEHWLAPSLNYEPEAEEAS
jgi:hypothetical protein